MDANDKLVTFEWQVFCVGAACLKYRSTSDEFKEVQKKYYAHQQELITGIAGLNKDSGKIVEEKEILAPIAGLNKDSGKVVEEKEVLAPFLVDDFVKATAAAQEEGEKNETAAAAAATVQEETEE